MGLNVNGHTYEWGDVRNETEGTSIEGVTSISYGHGVDPQDVKAAGFAPKDFTKGQYSADDVKIEMLQAYWDAWRNQLGNGYMRKRFTYTVSYADDGDDVVTDTLKQCQIKKVEKSPKQGSDSLMVTVTLKALKVIEGGVDPINA